MIENEAKYVIHGYLDGIVSHRLYASHVKNENGFPKAFVYVTGISQFGMEEATVGMILITIDTGMINPAFHASSLATGISTFKKMYYEYAGNNEWFMTNFKFRKDGK